VRCVFRWTEADDRRYEERITLWRAADLDAAIVRADAEAREYAENTGATYLGLAQGYETGEKELTNGGEVFSLLRESALPPAEYLDRHFDTANDLGRALYGPMFDHVPGVGTHRRRHRVHPAHRSRPAPGRPGADRSRRASSDRPDHAAVREPHGRRGRGPGPDRLHASARLTGTRCHQAVASWNAHASISEDAESSSDT
jgi:hypothetical protein